MVSNPGTKAAVGRAVEAQEPAVRLLRAPLSGVSAVPVTPMTNGGDELDHASLRNVVHSMADAGVTSFFAAGHTGEFYSLSLTEWEATVGTIRGAVGSRGHTFAAVGHDVRSACEMASISRGLGCCGTVIHQPPHPTIGAAGYLNYVAEIVQTSGLPTVLYLTASPIAEAVASRISSVDGVIGVKWGIPDIDVFVRVSQQTSDAPAGGITWVCGLGERWAQRFFDHGVMGYSSGLVNVHPALVLRYHAALLARDQTAVASMWPSISRFESLRLIDGGAVTVIKSALSRRGRCESTVRPPLSEPDASVIEAIDELLQRWDDEERDGAISASTESIR